MKSKKIIHLITTIERGGAEKQLLILAREQVKIGLGVEIIFLKGEPDLATEFEKFGCKVNHSISNMNFVFQILWLFKYFRENSYPVHAHLPKSELFAAVTCPKRRFIFTRHNSEGFWPEMPKIMSKLVSRFVCTRATQGIAISNAVKEFILATGEVSRKFNVDVVYYGYDSSAGIRQDRLLSISQIVNNSNTNYKIGTIGRLVNQKDFPTLIKAFKILLFSLPDSELFIVGEGVLKKQLEFTVKKLEITNKVHFLGKIEQIAEFLFSIDLFVLPSKYEGFGLVLLEAMVAKKPILATNSYSIPEVLGFDYPGLFSSGDIELLSSKMYQALSDINYSNSLVSCYDYQLKKFESANMATNILKIYDKVGF